MGFTYRPKSLPISCGNGAICWSSTIIALCILAIRKELAMHALGGLTRVLQIQVVRVMNGSISS